MAKIKSTSTNQKQGGPALTFSGKTRIAKYQIIRQALFRFLAKRVVEACHRSTARSI